jgi:hypothetical protein
VGLKLIFLVVSRAMSLIRLSKRESWWKDAEILMVRHQLAVAQRQRERLAGMRLIVTPGTILRWHRDIVRRRWARLSRRGRSGRPATHRNVRSVVLRLAGARVVRSAIQAPRMNSIMERWIGSCRRELLDRTLIWNQRHLMTVLREYEDFYNTHRPHRTLNQAAPLRPLPDGVTNLDRLRVRRRDRAGGVIHEYRLVA